MAAAPELTYQSLSSVQGANQPSPVTITAAATIAPTTFLTIISGTTAVTTITPPILGTHMLAFRLATTNFGGFGSSGNISLASLTNATVWTNKVTLMVYDPISAKYHPIYEQSVSATNT